MIRLLFLFIFLCTLISCDSSKIEQNEMYKDDFDKILSTYDLKGVILVYDPQTKSYFSNDFQKATVGYLPASTFKIPNAMISMETNMMKSDTSLIKWDGKQRDFDDWEKDLTLREAFQVSCVPCFQEIARKTGTKKMQTYLHKLGYNTMLVNDSTVDNFWLEGESHISAFEQIDFLERFHNKKLPILNTTRDHMLKIMEIEKNDRYILYGKTGWSYKEENNNGWFVGFVEKNNKTYYFAVNVEPQNAKNLEKFIPGRKQVTLNALEIMKVI